MVWKSNAPQGAESAKVRLDVVPYMHGRVLDLGCGPEKVFPAVIGVDNDKDLKLFGIKARPTVVADCATLDLFADQSVDTVFSSHLLEHIEDYKGALTHWWRVLKPGGYLVLYLPHADHYPNMGMPGANPDHKHDFRNEDVLDAMLAVMSKSGAGADLVVDEVRTGGDEYSFLQVYRKRSDECYAYAVQQRPAKSLGIIRWGGYGDALWISAILPALKAEGWHITLYAGKQTEVALRHDPHIDRIEVFPDNLFGDGAATTVLQTAYWMHLETKHERLINLIGSVEVTLLPSPAERRFFLPYEQRKRLMDVNYIEQVAQWAGVPFESVAPVKFYPTAEEQAWALVERAKIDGPLVMINPGGSSATKWWPHAQKLMHLLDAQGVHSLVVGDLKGAPIKPTRLGRVLGTDVDIRKVFALAALCDVVVGTESAIVNSVSHEQCFKVVTLSHSSANNLTRDWVNTLALAPTDLPCYPCHRIHVDGTYCNIVPNPVSSACQFAASATVVAEEVQKWLRGDIKQAA